MPKLKVAASHKETEKHDIKKSTRPPHFARDIARKRARICMRKKTFLSNNTMDDGSPGYSLAHF